MLQLTRLVSWIPEKRQQGNEELIDTHKIKQASGNTPLPGTSVSFLGTSQRLVLASLCRLSLYLVIWGWNFQQESVVADSALTDQFYVNT